MAIEVRCDECAKDYRLSDDLAGKKVRCKQCRNVITVPESGEDEFFDLETYEEVPHEMSTASVDDANDDGLWSGPAFDRPKKKKQKKKPNSDGEGSRKPRKRKRRKQQSMSTETLDLLIWLGGGAAVVIGFLIAGFFNPWITFGGGIACCAVGGIAVYWHACENDCGLLYRFVPFYALYYTLSVFSEVWHWVVLDFVGIFLIIASAFFNAFHEAGPFLQPEDEEYSLTLTVETRNISDEFDDDPNFQFDEIESPTEANIELKFSNLPWDDVQLSCTAYLESPWSGDSFNAIQLDQHEWEPGAERGLRIYWEHYTDDGEYDFYKQAKIETVDAAIPIFQAFLKGDSSWDTGLTWEDANFEGSY